MKTITLIKDFHARPYGRDEYDSNDANGELFCNILAKNLHEHALVHVVLDGYNRYGRSFLDEAFGGLIRKHGFTKEQLDQKLKYTHSTVKSVEDVISSRIEKAEQDRMSR